MEHMLITDSELVEVPQPSLAAGPPEGAARYPCELTLYLGQELLDKLGRSAADFKAGQDLVVRARATVRSVRDTAKIEGESSPEPGGDSVDIQITHLELRQQDDFDEAWEEANA